jgi:hypothetical protein
VTGFVGGFPRATVQDLVHRFVSLLRGRMGKWFDLGSAGVSILV